MSTQFISVMTPAASADTLSFDFETYDLTNNVAFTFSVSSITGLETASQLATKICTQLNTYLIQNSQIYTGISYYQDQIIPGFTAIAARSEHIVSIYSQAFFSVTQNTNDTGSVIKIKTRPGLVTVAEARSIGLVTGLDYSTADGDSLTDDQLADLICIASADLCAFLKQNIVLTYYYQHETTDWQWAVMLQKTPIINFFAPQVRIPQAFITISSSTLYNTAKQNYMLDTKTGYLSYRYAQSLVQMYEPFDWLNEVLITYLAGYFQIPQEIKNVVCSYASQVLTRYGEDVESYKGGSFQVKYASTGEGFNEYIAVLRPFFMSGE